MLITTKVIKIYITHNLSLSSKESLRFDVSSFNALESQTIRIVDKLYSRTYVGVGRESSVITEPLLINACNKLLSNQNFLNAREQK